MSKHGMDLKIDYEDVIESFENEIQNLKTQIKQLKHFGEIQVQINSKQSKQIRDLVNENIKLKKYVDINILNN
tara:strand:+ start:1291 stop:1509 length:219 start_codon:yes stop_codon:yes gene_type:complete